MPPSIHLRKVERYQVAAAARRSREAARKAKKSRPTEGEYPKYDSNLTSAASSSPPHYSPTSIVDVEICLRPLPIIVEESREEKVVPCVPTLLDPSEEGAGRFVFSLLLGGVWPMPSTLSPRP